MADGKRPGGLTALAVLNFVFGGFGVLAVLGAAALLGAANELTEGAVADGMGMGIGMFQFLLMALSAALLIVSGVGYIGQKRVMGRMMGNFYGVTSIVNNGLSIANGGEFSFFTIIGLVYPVLTLILLNTTFKEDLVN
jgi:hypothetical protein|tara:strand:+ start:130 stop:543 length:414 start_codon:yes stop_codon:yes gene_type:complete